MISRSGLMIVGASFTTKRVVLDGAFTCYLFNADDAPPGLTVVSSATDARRHPSLLRRRSAGGYLFAGAPC